jgi:hypothetical protein
MKRLIILIIFVSIITPLTSGQDVNVISSFDTSKIYIGDQIEYKVIVDQPSDLKLTFPFFKDTLCKNIEIIAGPLRDSSTNQNGRVNIVESYLITSFDSGLYQLPPVYVEMKNENGLKRFYSDYSQLEVMRVRIAPADTTAKIFDIINPYRAPLTVGEILPWVLIAMLTGVVVWAAIFYIRKLKRSKKGIEPLVIPDPAHVIAFRELERLREDQLWQKGEIKNYYTRLTEIMRQYLEDRFRVFSLELTTSETLDALLKTGFKKNGKYDQLRTILTGADLVKFAKYNPEPLENETHFKNSWNFVLATKEDDVFEETTDDNDKTGEGNL